ncbi:hypothetical protein KKF38_03445 [Patescibacteria group bacterium]|nr:hypothetical protein [Patescibacteria group bacterium]
MNPLEKVDIVIEKAEGFEGDFWFKAETICEKIFGEGGRLQTDREMKIKNFSAEKAAEILKNRKKIEKTYRVRISTSKAEGFVFRGC